MQILNLYKGFKVEGLRFIINCINKRPAVHNGVIVSKVV